MNPQRMVEMEHGTAVTPPRLNLKRAATIAYGIPTIGPPSIDPIRIVIVMTFAGELSMNMDIEARMPKTEKIIAQ